MKIASPVLFISSTLLALLLSLLFVSSSTTTKTDAARITAVDHLTAKNLNAFNKWLHSLDADVKIHLDKKDAVSGNQIFTNASLISKGDSILKVPLSHVLCDETLTKPEYEGAVEYHQIMKRHLRSPDDRIALAVMVERALGTASKWEPWIKVLPEIGVGLYLPHLWPEEVRKEISPVRFREHADTMNKQLKQKFKAELEVPLRLLREFARVTLRKAGIEPDHKKLDSDFSLKRYIWAHSIVVSRAWNLQGRKYLVPGADMFNHDYDVEDKAYDYKRDTLIKTPRSQKFTYFHLIHDPKNPHYKKEELINAQNKNAKLPFVELLSDRRNSEAGTELFESYGDSPDAIYFQYLGFVASDVEEMVLAATVGASESAPPHLDLPLFAQAWAPSTVRNRRDCFELDLQPPLGIVARKKEGEGEGNAASQKRRRLPSSDQTNANNNNDGTPPSYSDEEVSVSSEKTNQEKASNNNDEGEEIDEKNPPFQEPPKPMVAWARRMIGVGGPDGYDDTAGDIKVCVRFGEIHPLHFLFHYLTQLPQSIAKKGDCIEKTVDPLSSYAPDTRLYPASKVLLRKIKKCLVQNYGGPIAHANNTVRAVRAMTNDIARRVLPHTFGITERKEVQHFEDNVIDDAIEAKIIKCRLEGITERSQCFAGFGHLLEADMPPKDTWDRKMKNATSKTIKMSSGKTAHVEVLGDKDLGVPVGAVDVANLMRIRFSLQQKMILLQTQERLERKRVDAVTTQKEILDALASEDGNNKNGDKKNKKQKNNNKKKNDGIVHKTDFDDEDDNSPVGDL